MLAAASHTLAGHLYSKLAYDPVKDFTGVAFIGNSCYAIAAPGNLGVNNLADYVKLLKSQPGKMNYASAGVGSTTHLAMEMLKNASQTYALHIPYNGNGPAGTALIAGQVEILFGSLPALLPHVKSARVRPLAVGTPKRSPSLPEVPTVAESGYAGFDASLWLAFFAPAGTPQPIVDRLHKEIVATVQSADTREALDKAGAEPITSTPAELAAMIKDGVGKYAKVIKAAGVKPE